MYSVKSIILAVIAFEALLVAASFVAAFELAVEHAHVLVVEV